jgi:hypothetical protein
VKLRLVALTFVLMQLAGPAWASCGPVPMPPAAYDHPPTRNFIDERINHWDVDAECRRLANFSYQTNRLEACVVARRLAAPIRIIPNDADPDYTECLMAHENGHLNGWPSYHPNAR